MSLIWLRNRVALGAKWALVGAAAISFAVIAATSANAQQRQAKMPEPYVSPTFDAVLMPVTQAVVKQFKLPRNASGAVVVSVEPGGVGDLYGLEPGEVISTYGSKKFRRPADLDAMVAKGLKDGGAYFYFEGLRKGKPKRTIIYLQEQDFRKPVPVQNIKNWRSYNAPAFNFNRWYDPYSYYIVDIYDYTFYYIDEVIYTDVFITTYNSSETYFYYDYTEISSLNVRETWIEEESYIYCGDISGYSCGVDEIGYPVEQEWETCSGAPGDDWCLPPDEVNYDYCSSFPSDPACDGGGVSADDYCAYNPEDPSCGGGGDYVEEDYCTTNPEAAECGGGSAVAEDDYCTNYPDDPACTGDGGEYVEEDYCATNPDAPECGGGEVAAEDYCATYPDAAECGGSAAEEAYYPEQAEAEEYVDPGYNEEPVYEEPVYEEPVYEEPVYEEPVYEEPVYEEPVYEEPVYEEPVYEEPVYEEPVYEEPVYEEPVYEEPVYEEPAYDGGGGGCYYDEEGNEICG